MNFNELKLDGRILKAVKAAGYETPSPIQEKAIPPALDGRDVLGCAQTGTGKTAAFALPILNNLNGKPQNCIRALVLTPTRELALQIEESFQTYGKYLPYRCGVVMGGVSQQKQIELLKRGVDVLVATPGRLLDLHAQGLADLSGLEFFVLDEADRMLDMGFIHDVKKVIALLPRRRQTMFFTATLPPEIVKLAKSLLVNPVEVAVTPVSSTVELTEQLVYLPIKRARRIFSFLFCKRRGRGVHARLYAHEIRRGQIMPQTRAAKIEARHSRRQSQGARQNALDSFKGKIRVLVATDIAARGIDIEDLPSVVNFELPNIPETYVHRIGRTGRAGKRGTAVSLCDFDEKEYLADIEKLIGKKLKVVEENEFPMTVFVKSPPKVPQPRPSRRGQAQQR
ncbi:MAG: DEAD/DEAH box helicase [Candidatus Borkfalkia sp.]